MESGCFPHMKYITGMHALNLPCPLLTTGDWHHDSLDWNNPMIRDSNCSLWGRYGIYKNQSLCSRKICYVVNHIRAVLDYLFEGNFAMAQGMKNDYICNDEYTLEIFQKSLN